MANNLYANVLISDNKSQIKDTSDEELSSYMDDDCGTCKRCGKREYLNNSDMCNDCRETWG